MKAIVMTTIIGLFAAPVWAQIDEGRMERDLEISKNILSTLLKEEDVGMISRRSIKANYIDGYGVIFKLPGSIMSYDFMINAPRVGTVSSNRFEFKDGNKVIIMGDDEESEALKKRIEEEIDRDYDVDVVIDEKYEVEIDEENDGKDVKETRVTVHSDRSQKGNKDSEALQNALVTFLADYADLIGQLKPDDKITVKQESGEASFVFIWKDDEGNTSEEKNNGGLSVTASKKDISDFRSGKIDRNTFEERVEIEMDKPKEKIAELDIFASTFRQFFSPRFSKTYFTNRTPDYERIEGVGVIYEAPTYSSYKEDELYYLPALGDDRFNDEERKEKVESLYPQFQQDLKAFIVDYGRTIRGLKDEEKLIMKIKMTRCNACNIPKYLEASVPISVLMKYDQQKISRDMAMNQVRLKEIN
ncbi:MAG TPA: hypothetical protein DDY13_13740 [Cytophagales bacterium]|mgnify:CR=1 FL=1|jgi:hypothetical protein|nr:hypothetical protein [Cytophagales bacterium]